MTCRQKRFRHVGWPLALSVFLLTLVMGTFSPIIFAPKADAIDSGGRGTWYDPYTIEYTDPKGHTLEFNEDSEGDNGFDQINHITRFDAVKPGSCAARPGPGCPNSESLSDYQKRVPGDTDICGLPGASPVAWINVANIGQSNQSAKEIATGYTILGTCGTDNGGSVTFTNQRPEVPGVAASDASVAWDSIGPILRYTGKTDLSQYGIKNGTEFDVSSVSGNSMTLVTTAPSPQAACAGQNSYLVVNPYQTFNITQLFVPNVLDGKSGCELTPAALPAPKGTTTSWLSITNKYPDPKQLPSYDSASSATWLSSNTMQLNATEFADQGIPNGLIFTQSSLVNNHMILAAASAAPGCSGVSTFDANPYLATQFVSLTAYLTNADIRHPCTTKTVVLQLSNTNPLSTINLSGTASNNSNPNNGGCPVTTGSGIDWLLCPLFNVGAQAVKPLRDNVQNFLYINTDQIFGGSAFESAFVSLRNISVALLVLAGLFMVLSQAAGLEVFSAYTVRKALPRVVIAAIGISLAWPLMQFVVTFFNDTGTWIADIILSATNVPTSGDAASGIAEAGGALISGSIVGGGVLFVFGFLGALSFIASIIIALLTALIVLVARQLVILACIILAPIAIAASVLPGTEKLFTFWRSTLLSTLAMFPLIMGIIATGTALSNAAKVAGGNALSSSNGGNGSQQWALLALVAYFVPYFIILSTPALGSAFMSRIAGFAKQTTSGLSKGLQQFRAGERQYLHQQRMQGRSMLDRIRLGKNGNPTLGELYRRSFTRGAIDPRQLLPGERGALHRREAKELVRNPLNAATRETLKGAPGSVLNDDEGNEIAQWAKNDEEFISEHARRHSGDRASAIASLAGLKAGYHAPMGSSGMRQAAFYALQSSTTAGVGSDKTDINSLRTGLDDRILRAGELVRNGNLNLDNAAQAVKFSPGGAARPEYAKASYGTIKNAIKYVVENGSIQPGNFDIITGDAWAHMKPGDFANAREEAFTAIAPEAIKSIKKAYADVQSDPNNKGFRDEFAKQISRAGRMYEMLRNMGGSEAENWGKLVMGVEIGNPTAANPPELQAIRRDIGSAKTRLERATTIAAVEQVQVRASAVAQSIEHIYSDQGDDLMQAGKKLTDAARVQGFNGAEASYLVGVFNKTVGDALNRGMRNEAAFDQARAAVANGAQQIIQSTTQAEVQAAQAALDAAEARARTVAAAAGKIQSGRVVDVLAQWRNDPDYIKYVHEYGSIGAYQAGQGEVPQPPAPPAQPA